MVFRLLAPAILPLHKKIEDIRKNNELKFDEELSDIPFNKIDSNIFRTTRPAPANTISLNEHDQSPQQVKKTQNKSKTFGRLHRKNFVQKK